MAITDLRKFVAPEFVFGTGARNLAARYASNHGAKKVLVVTDQGIISAGWIDPLLELLQEESIPYVIFSDIHPNPRDQEVMRGAEIFQQERCNLIIVMGGGSPMDCAKGIGIVSSNHRHVLTFEGVDEVPLPAPPLICIPTTAGTSADVSQFSIINDSHRRVKIAIISKTVVPDAALIDPETTLTMDPYLTACTGMDALTHAFEAYVSNAQSVITDLHALEAIRIIWKALPLVMQNPQDLEFRSQMMLASLYAGLAFSNASLGAVHAMAHSLGGYLDLPHGECNAILLEHVVHYNFEAAAGRYMQIADTIGLGSSHKSPQYQRDSLIEALVKLRTSVGITRSLGQNGVQTTNIPELAQKAIKDPCMVTNPRTPTLQEIEGVYAAAL
jgi:alcohol dehydrogenase class IV